MVIYKYPLEMKPVQEVEMPHGAQIIHVAAQYEIPCLWAIVDPNSPTEKRVIGMATTGAHFPEGELSAGLHLGSFMLAGGKFVGHLFESPHIGN